MSFAEPAAKSVCALAVNLSSAVLTLVWLTQWYTQSQTYSNANHIIIHACIVQWMTLSQAPIPWLQQPADVLGYEDLGHLSAGSCKLPGLLEHPWPSDSEQAGQLDLSFLPGNENQITCWAWNILYVKGDDLAYELRASSSRGQEGKGCKLSCSLNAKSSGFYG